ncbi:hypothetical protein SKAU_G00183820 [Synaphobranchus kaupii]|uniref:Uncharacterized protein n=1 Tax=Synaphobranchus kaupii TaxID=118154 RepID=A0A9Q1FCN5_SYNKA|nr:hypothetical protein SKAU_G00183820 [Synaphobranchus kaupii]
MVSFPLPNHLAVVLVSGRSRCCQLGFWKRADGGGRGGGEGNGGCGPERAQPYCATSPEGGEFPRLLINTPTPLKSHLPCGRWWRQTSA